MFKFKFVWSNENRRVLIVLWIVVSYVIPLLNEILLLVNGILEQDFVIIVIKFKMTSKLFSISKYLMKSAILFVYTLGRVFYTTFLSLLYSLCTNLQM